MKAEQIIERKVFFWQSEEAVFQPCVHGETHTLSAMLTSAPLLSRTLITSRCLCSAAQMIGVQPPLSWTTRISRAGLKRGTQQLGFSDTCSFPYLRIHIHLSRFQEQIHDLQVSQLGGMVQAGISIFFLQPKDRETALSLGLHRGPKGSADTHHVVDAGPTLDQVPRHLDVVVDDGFHQRSPEVLVLRVHVGPSLAGNKPA